MCEGQNLTSPDYDEISQDGAEEYPKSENIQSIIQWFCANLRHMGQTKWRFVVDERRLHAKIDGENQRFWLTTWCQNIVNFNVVPNVNKFTIVAKNVKNQIGKQPTNIIVVAHFKFHLKIFYAF